MHTTTNGQEAINKIYNQKIDFCAAVLDISMPDMGDITTMKEIRKRKPDGFLNKPFRSYDM